MVATPKYLPLHPWQEILTSPFHAFCLGYHMQNSPGGNRGRHQRGFQQQRRWEPGNNRYHGSQQRKQWNRSDDHHIPSHDDEVMKLSPSSLMTSREKEWLVKIQLMTLLSDDAYTADYYYVVSYRAMEMSRGNRFLVPVYHVVILWTLHIFYDSAIVELYMCHEIRIDHL